jgi:DNA-binding CsgD family transcriptional regulator
MLVGRGRETAAVDSALTAARAGRGGALLFTGEPGVGKSTVLDYARESADGFLVLDTTGIEFESELAFGGLHKLLLPVLGLLDAIPAPQAAGLRAAFALSDDAVVDRFRISLGTLTLLSAAAESQPVLCIVDDIQWLDDGSAAALFFAARRLEAEALAIVFAARDDPTRPFQAPGVQTLRVGPLVENDARAVAVESLGPDAPPDVVEWVLDRANGNPLALAELPQTLTDAQRAGTEPVGDTAGAVTSVERVYLDRLAGLPTTLQHLLLVVASEESGDRATIAHAAGRLGLQLDELGLAEKRGLVAVDGDTVRFRHPLVRSAVYRNATFKEREGAHAVLAEVFGESGDPDRRAWHRAMATPGPDDDVASELEATADRAQRRAGYAGASAALERAAELSTDPADRVRRLVAATRTAWQAGKRDRALNLLTAVEDVVTEPALLAECKHIRGLVDISCGSLVDAGASLLSGGRLVSASDPRKALEMFLDTALAAGRAGHVELMITAGREASAVTATDETDGLRRDLLVDVGGFSVCAPGTTADAVRGVVGRAAGSPDFRVLAWAAFGAAILGSDATHTALQVARTATRQFGAVPPLILQLETEVVAYHLAGRYVLEAEAREGLRLAEEAGYTNAATAFVAFLAVVESLRGNDDACRSYAARVTAESASSGMAMANSIAQWAVALLDLSRGSPERALTRLDTLRGGSVGEAHPLFVLMTVPDLVEAYVQAGRAAEAADTYAPLHSYAAADAPPWALAMAARCRALLADAEDAERGYEEALGHLATLNRRFDRARVEHLYGSHLRRQRRRADARDHLRAAIEGYEQLGAEVWAERARVELRATGETARKRDPSTATQLTPQELQIARLVGAGNSNKDVATQLFLSPRTVEYHLAKVFTKLGITSRADLIGLGESLEPVG